MRKFDQAAINSGTSETELIKRAGRALYHEFSQLSGGIPCIVIILIGPGNNGADASEVGRHLKKAGYQTIEVLSKTFDSKSEALLSECLSKADYIIDGLLGTGATGKPRGAIKKIIEIVNNAEIKGKIISIDIPSGVNTDTGQADLAINADITLTIQCLKRGITQYPGRARSGEIKIVDIGLASEPTEYALLTPQTLPRLPKRDSASHKGNFGCVLVVGGSPDMPGAPVLAGEAALRAGAGLVRVASGGQGGVVVPPELMFLTPKGQKKGLPSLREIKSFLEKSRPILVFGPGLGQGTESIGFTKKILELVLALDLYCVLDADGLNNFAKLKGIKLSNNFIVTPHPGEAATTLKTSSDLIQSDRFRSAERLRDYFGDAVVVLKGAGTIVKLKEAGWVNLTGNPYLATAGSGDVLAGLIAGLVAQGLSPEESARLGVYIHGAAAEELTKRRPGPIVASELIAELPSLVGRFTK